MITQTFVNAANYTAIVCRLVYGNYRAVWLSGVTYIYAVISIVIICSQTVLEWIAPVHYIYMRVFCCL